MRLEINQGTSEWKSLRKIKVTGTDASIILGLNPYKTEDKLLRQKLGLEEDDYINDKMQLGTDLEPIARDLFCRKVNDWYVPSVHLHDIDDWMMCSTDGITLDGSIILEIKCGKSAHEHHQKGVIPDYYMAQIQHNLYVSGADICNFVTYWDSTLLLTAVNRNHNFIENLIEKEREFYEKLMNESLDYSNNDAWIEAEENLIKAKTEYELAKLKLEDAKKDAISLITGNGAVGKKVRIIKRRGRSFIDYKSIPELSSIDLSPYTKPGSSYWHTEFIKEIQNV